MKHPSAAGVSAKTGVFDPPQVGLEAASLIESTAGMAPEKEYVDVVDWRLPDHS